MLIRTDLSPDQASDLVRGLIRPEGFVGGLSYSLTDRRPFIGRSKGPQFRFYRRRPWHNSFTPLISGAVKPDAGGAAFEASMRLAIPVLVIAPAILLVFGIEAVRELFRYLVSSGADGAVAPVIFVSLFTAFGVISYGVERRSAERILHEALTR